MPSGNASTKAFPLTSATLEVPVSIYQWVFFMIGRRHKEVEYMRPYTQTIDMGVCVCVKIERKVYKSSYVYCQLRQNILPSWHAWSFEV